MDWNKNNPRYRRPGRRRKKSGRAGFFAGLGAKLDAFVRKIGRKAPAEPARQNLPQAASTLEEIFDDLKISLPKSRATKSEAGPAAPSPSIEEAEAEYAAGEFELDDDLERDYLDSDEEAGTEIFDEVVFLDNDDEESPAPAEATRVEQAAGGLHVGEDRAGAPRPESSPAPGPSKFKTRLWGRGGGARDGRPKPGRLKFAALAVAAAAALIGGAWWAVNFFTGAVPTAKVARIPVASLPTVEAPPPGLFEQYAAREQQAVVTEYTVRDGDTLSQALEAVGLGARAEGAAIGECLTAERGLEVVRPGARVRAYWRDEGKTELGRLEYHPSSGAPPFVVRPEGGGAFWRYNLGAPPLSVTTAARGTVESTLWAAGSAAGLDPGLIMNMADIMASEIDFLADIQAGDSFQVLYSRTYADGRPAGGAAVEMLRMNNKGRDYELYRYVNAAGEAGYYDQQGRSSKKTFFNSPLQYTRISSGFNLNRLHPIYKVRRAHEGVDYAAPAGTPVSSVADGVVVFAGWSGGYGRLITIKHDEVYTTMYAHLSRLARGLKRGDRVGQGDLIGYVGATGTATGPHLDFRMKKNNVFIDPEAVLSKQEGRKLEDAEAQAFSQLVTAARNRLRENLEARPGP